VTLSATQITNNGLALMPNPAKVGIDDNDATNLAIVLKKLCNGPLIIILKRVVKKGV